MLKRRGMGIFVLLALAACSPPPRPAERRSELQEVGPAELRVLAAEGQLPFCLLFSVSRRGTVRQLTMSPEQKAVPCAAGEPVGGVTYRIPPVEGPVKLYLLFADREIDANPIARQVHEISMDGKPVRALDLRVPGQIRIESFDFTPSGG